MLGCKVPSSRTFSSNPHLLVVLEELDDVIPSLYPPVGGHHRVDDDEPVLVAAEPVVAEHRVRLLGVVGVVKNVDDDAVAPG